MNIFGVDLHLTLSFSDDTSGSESSPEKEARHLIKKIRRHIRLLNRKWTELNQGCNEWQARLDEVLEVYITIYITFFCSIFSNF